MYNALNDSAATQEQMSKLGTNVWCVTAHGILPSRLPHMCLITAKQTATGVFTASQMISLMTGFDAFLYFTQNVPLQSIYSVIPASKSDEARIVAARK